MKILAVLLLFIPSCLFAESYVYFGKYFNSTLSAYPGSITDMAQYRAGIHVEKSIAEDFITAYAEDETLIDGTRGFGFTPASTNFILGAKIDFNQIEVRLQHECKHPHEDRPLGWAEQYDLIEVRYKIINGD